MQTTYNSHSLFHGSKRELIREFYEWIVTTRNELERRLLHLRRDVRDAIPLALCCAPIREELEPVCFDLAVTENRLSLFDKLYLVAMDRETEEYIDFSNSDSLLLWEWFLQSLKEERKPSQSF